MTVLLVEGKSIGEVKESTDSPQRVIFMLLAFSDTKNINWVVPGAVICMIFSDPHLHHVIVEKAEANGR